MPQPITVRRAPNMGGYERGTRGILRVGALALPCALGRGGVRALKLEGDGATPIGRHHVMRAIIRGDRMRMPPPARLRTSRVRPRDGWCDAPGHASYNRPVRLPCRASAESLWRADQLYDVVVVLDYNVTTRSRGRGSAIFWHIARQGFAPTEGCIAVRPSDMRLVLPLLKRGRPLDVIG